MFAWKNRALALEKDYMCVCVLSLCKSMVYIEERKKNHTSKSKIDWREEKKLNYISYKDFIRLMNGCQ